MSDDLSNQGRLPSFDQLIWPAIVALREMGGSASNEELLAKIIEVERIPDDVAGLLQGNGRRTRLGYNLAWARTYLKRGGVLQNSSRGIWSLTDLGAHITPDKVAEIPRAVRQSDAERRSGESPEASEEELQASEIRSLFWKDQLLQTLQQMRPGAFERLSQRMLREAGFIKVEVTGRPGDGGIDGVGVLRVNLLSFTVLFQCKRYVGTVGSGAIRDFRGAMVGRSDKGLIITTGTFSVDAQKEATRDGAPSIDLIDGDRLCDLLRELSLGVSIEQVEIVSIDTDWFHHV